MITCGGGKDIRRPIKLPNFLRYYENVHGMPLAPEMAEEEAAKEGLRIDYAGACQLPAPGGRGQGESNTRRAVSRKPRSRG